MIHKGEREREQRETEKEAGIEGVRRKTEHKRREERKVNKDRALIFAILGLKSRI